MCSLGEHHRTRSGSEVWKVPVFCRVLDPTKSYVPRSLESHEVLGPAKSWIPWSPRSCEVLNPTKSQVSRGLWSSSRHAGSCGLVLRGLVSIRWGSNPCILGAVPLASGLWGFGISTACLSRQGCLAFCPFILLVGNGFRVLHGPPVLFLLQSHQWRWMMICSSVFWRAAWKFFFIPAGDN